MHDLIIKDLSCLFFNQSTVVGKIHSQLIELNIQMPRIIIKNIDIFLGTLTDKFSIQTG